MKKLISIIVALVLILGLASVSAFADGTVEPTSSSTATSHPGITSVTVAGEPTVFQTDDNTGSDVYIRAELPNSSTTEYSLKHASVVIEATGIVSVFYGATIIQKDSNVGNTYTYTLDLFNKAYTVVTASADYTLAAGIQDGRVEIDSNDPLKVGGTLNSVTVDAYGSNQNNPYMGNPYYTEWTFINYFISATLPSGTISAITGDLSLASGASLTGAGVTNYTSGSDTFDFSNNASFTVSNGSTSRLYRSRVAIDGQTVLIKEESGYRNYDLNFSEVKASTYYTATGSTVKPKVDEIEAAWNVFITEGYTAPANSSVMSIIMAFDNWARTTNKPDSTDKYFSSTSDFGGGYYLSKLDGLDASDCDYMAGFMYSDDPNGYYWTSKTQHSNIPMVGADGYTMTSSTRIIWFYTIDFTNWF